MRFNDYKRYTDRRGIFGFLNAYYRTANYRVIFWFRVRMRFRKYPILSMLCNLIFWRIAYGRSIEIPSGCKIGDGFYIIHSGNAVINSNATIGENFTAVSSFNIGGVFSGDKIGAPTIGDNVYLGTGVVILGDVNIGNNVLIGANSVVLSDIPSDSFAAGSPARVVNNTGSSGYIVRPL